jgi:phosphoribosylformimino-5-aminoimidazole carboxamide ribotide isomerase
MRILPVLDLLHGQVVRGIAGRRDQYRPVVSRWTTSSDPLGVAGSIRDAFGFTEFYVADLDAIVHRAPSVAIVEGLLGEGFRLRIDAGIRNADDAVCFSALGADGPACMDQPLAATGSPAQTTLVLGLETLQHPDELPRILAGAVADRILFSLDLKAGTPLGNQHWPTSARAIADLAVAAGIRRLLILDLAKVGIGDGLGTDDLCRELRHAYPKIELLAGGGVRGLDDLLHLETLGLDAVLVASALHDGRLLPRDLSRFE